MLVLARKLDQSIQIGDDITLTIVAVKGNTVRIGISAPDHIRVIRSELQVEPGERRSVDSAPGATDTASPATVGRGVGGRSVGRSAGREVAPGPFKPTEDFSINEFRSATGPASRRPERRGGLGLASRVERVGNRRPSDLARSADASSPGQEATPITTEVVELTISPSQAISYREGGDRWPLLASTESSAGAAGRRIVADALPDLYEVQHLRVCFETPSSAEATRG